LPCFGLLGKLFVKSVVDAISSTKKNYPPINFRLFWKGTLK